MSDLLVWKEKLQNLYAKYSVFIDKGIQFLLALVTFWFVSSKLGYMKPLAQPVVSVVLAVLCTFLPAVFTVLAASALVIVHLFSLSMGVAATAAAIFVLMFIFYFRFVPKTAVIILLIPLTFLLKVPFVVPIVCGLAGTPILMLPVALGVIVYEMVMYVNASAAVIKSADGGMVQQITLFIQKVFQNKEMWITIAAFSICLLVVYVLRRLSVDHAWEIAIVSGAVMNIIVLVGGEIVFNVNVSYVELILGNIAACLIAFLVEFFIFAVDYSRTEQIQFEDDEYYYYVKAVPKIQITPPEKTVKKINERQGTAAEKPEKSEKERQTRLKKRTDARKTAKSSGETTSGKQDDFLENGGQRIGEKQISEEELAINETEELLLAKSLQEELDIQSIVDEELKK